MTFEFKTLSERESQILQLLRQGKSNDEITSELHLSRSLRRD